MSDKEQQPPPPNYPADYEPAKVWTWDQESGGKWASINRPVAGATHEKVLPVGKHPLQLHSLATPNGVKVTVMLEDYWRLVTKVQSMMPIWYELVMATSLAAALSTSILTPRFQL